MVNAMSRCVVDVNLAERQRGAVEPATYRVGEPMNLTVTVDVDALTSCKSLDLALRVRGEGSGFTPDIVGYQERLFAGEWSPGRHTYRRTVPAPHQATTYEGSWVRAGWWVEVDANLGSVDAARNREQFVVLTPPRSHLELVLPPPETAQHRRELQAEREAEATRDKRYATGANVVCVVALLAFGLGGALRYSSAAAEEVWGPLMGLGGFVGGLLLLVALVGALSRRFGETNVQPLDIAVALHHRAGDKGESREEQGPDAITCVAYIDPNVTLDSVDAHLEVNEFTEWSELKNNGRRRRRFEVTAMRRISRLAGTSAPGEWRGVLAIPDEPLPPSIEDADGHGVIWQIAIVPKRPGVAREPERVVRRLQARLRAEPRATTT